jgi:hypothetical protein
LSTEPTPDDDENSHLLQQFPPEGKTQFDMGRGDTEPDPGVMPGRPRIVYRVGMNCTRAQAEAKARGLGVKYQRLFATARFWVFCIHD